MKEQKLRIQSVMKLEKERINEFDKEKKTKS